MTNLDQPASFGNLVEDSDNAIQLNRRFSCFIYGFEQGYAPHIYDVVTQQAFYPLMPLPTTAQALAYAKFWADSCGEAISTPVDPRYLSAA